MYIYIKENRLLIYKNEWEREVSRKIEKEEKVIFFLFSFFSKKKKNGLLGNIILTHHLT
jgi:hypothetical protein